MIVFIAIAPVSGWAQKAHNDIRFRLAQSYERSADFESALKIYAELYAEDSTNAVLFESLRRGYLQLKRYDEVIALFQRSLAQTPNDVGMLAQLGTFYAQKSDELKATESWERAIATDPDNEQTYRVVGSALAESRLFERAIAMYQRGRKACNNPNLFATEIALFHTIVLNYTDATREYINLIRQTPSMLSLVQQRMSSYVSRTQGLTDAITVVEDAAKVEPRNLMLLYLQAWLYMEGRNFDLAYVVYKTIDVSTGANGGELYNFAHRALRDKSYLAAANAFQDVLTIYPNFSNREQVYFGLARTLEDSTTAHDTTNIVSQNTSVKKPSSVLVEQYENVVHAFRQVITQFPKKETAAQSLLHIGILQQDRLLDLEAAQSTFETLSKVYAAHPGITIEGTLRLGDVFLAKGDLTKAEEEYLLLNRYVEGGDQRERGALRLAEIDYFRGNFKDALKKLNALTLNIIADIANDALKLKVFIEENTASGDQTLKEFAKASFLKHQMKYSDALDNFESMITAFPTSTLIDEVLMNIGDIFLQMQKYEDAVTSYEKLIRDFPESLVLDIALMKIGNTYQLGFHNSLKAIETYQKLLERHPNSIYVTDARKRIRELRGDNI